VCTHLTHFLFNLLLSDYQNRPIRTTYVHPHYFQINSLLYHYFFMTTFACYPIMSCDLTSSLNPLHISALSNKYSVMDKDKGVQSDQNLNHKVHLLLDSTATTNYYNCNIYLCNVKVLCTLHIKYTVIP
jgi:hypothetical protein